MHLLFVILSVSFVWVFNYVLCFRSYQTFNEPLDYYALQNMARKNFSEETTKKVNYVWKMYSQWRIQRNDSGLYELITCDLDDHETINEHDFTSSMCRFITEIKKVNGEQFPAKTLYEIVLCVQFYLESVGIVWKLLSDDKFSDLRFTLDNIMKQRSSKSVGCGIRKADVLTAVDEDILWSLGFLGHDNPEQLLNTVVFTIGLSCALRAGKEHRNLQSLPFNSQFSWHVGDDGYHYIRYTEDIQSKTNRGGLKHRKILPKVVNIYPILGSHRCPVAILGRYFSLLPIERTCKSLYLMLKKKFSPNCWYQDRPVGINKLQSVVRDVCAKAGLPGHYTNHSLRATAATRLYHNNFDEQIIQEFTGCRSIAVREYKRTSDSQLKSASSCIMVSCTVKSEEEQVPCKRMKLSQ